MESATGPGEGTSSTAALMTSALDGGEYTLAAPTTVVGSSAPASANDGMMELTGGGGDCVIKFAAASGDYGTDFYDHHDGDSRGVVAADSTAVTRLLMPGADVCYPQLSATRDQPQGSAVAVVAGDSYDGVISAVVLTTAGHNDIAADSAQEGGCYVKMLKVAADGGHDLFRQHRDDHDGTTTSSGSSRLPIMVAAPHKPNDRKPAATTAAATAMASSSCSYHHDDGCCHLLDLPSSCLSHIVSLTSFRDACQLACTCRSLAEFLRGEFPWGCLVPPNLLSSLGVELVSYHHDAVDYCSLCSGHQHRHDDSHDDDHVDASLMMAASGTHVSTTMTSTGCSTAATSCRHGHHRGHDGGGSCCCGTPHRTSAASLPCGAICKQQLVQQHEQPKGALLLQQLPDEVLDTDNDADAPAGAALARTCSHRTSCRSVHSTMRSGSSTFHSSFSPAEASEGHTRSRSGNAGSFSSCEMLPTNCCGGNAICSDTCRSCGHRHHHHHHHHHHHYAASPQQPMRQPCPAAAAAAAGGLQCCCCSQLAAAATSRTSRSSCQPLLLGKAVVFSLLRSPISLRRGAEKYFLSLDSAGHVSCCLPVTAMSVIWGEDARFWRMMDCRDSCSGKVACLLAVCWLQVLGTWKVFLPPGRYSLSWRLKVSNPRGGRRSCLSWKHPVKFSAETSQGGRMEAILDMSKAPFMGFEIWAEFVVGAFDVRGSCKVLQEMELRFALEEIDCSYWKGGFFIDCVWVRPTHD